MLGSFEGEAMLCSNAASVEFMPLRIDEVMDV